MSSLLSINCYIFESKYGKLGLWPLIMHLALNRTVLYERKIKIVSAENRRNKAI